MILDTGTPANLSGWWRARRYRPIRVCPVTALKSQAHMKNLAQVSLNIEYPNIQWWNIISFPIDIAILEVTHFQTRPTSSTECNGESSPKGTSYFAVTWSCLRLIRGFYSFVFFGSMIQNGKPVRSVFFLLPWVIGKPLGCDAEISLGCDADAFPRMWRVLSVVTRGVFLRGRRGTWCHGWSPCVACVVHGDIDFRYMEK